MAALCRMAISHLPQPCKRGSCSPIFQARTLRLGVFWPPELPQLERGGGAKTQVLLQNEGQRASFFLEVAGASLP